MDWQAQEAAAHLSTQHGDRDSWSIDSVQFRDSVDYSNEAQMEKFAKVVAVWRPETVA